MTARAKSASTTNLLDNGRSARNFSNSKLHEGLGQANVYAGYFIHNSDEIGGRKWRRSGNFVVVLKIDYSCIEETGDKDL